MHICAYNLDALPFHLLEQILQLKRLGNYRCLTWFELRQVRFDLSWVRSGLLT